MVKIRDPVTGKCIEDEEVLREFVNRNTKESVKCEKNHDKMGIDSVLYHVNEKKIIGFIECEGSWKSTWNGEEHPNWPSGTISVPLRRLKEFTMDNEELIEFNIIEREDFMKHKLHKKKFRPPKIKSFWVKLDYSGTKACFVDAEHILNRVNANSIGNIYVNEAIKRDDKTMINIGRFNDVNWGLENLIKFISDKIGIDISKNG